MTLTSYALAIALEYVLIGIFCLVISLRKDNLLGYVDRVLILQMILVWPLLSILVVIKWCMDATNWVKKQW